MPNEDNKLDLLNPNVSLPLDGEGIPSPLRGEGQGEGAAVILSEAKNEICHSERSEESSAITDSLKNNILSSDTAFRLLKDIEANPSATQRHLAAKHDISLGKTNYILNALIEKGIIKAQNFKNSKNKAAYMYVFTPEGIAIKAELARSFIQRKLREFEDLKAEIESLQNEAVINADNTTVAALSQEQTTEV
jgi:EPS-associated MarR family transcriptional regulator